MNKPLRIAFFPDSFLEVNGVAMTSNRLVAFARKRGFPFLCVHAGEKTEVRQDENITFVSLKRSPASFEMDEGLKYDPFFQRHVSLVRAELEKFRPDVFHITGLNDVSIVGAYLAWKMDIPLVGSWHTNLHEYAARRLRSKFGFLPEKFKYSFTGFIEKNILRGAQLYYKMPQVLLAPNQELIEMLERGTGRPARLMIRGVDTEKYSPRKRTVDDGIVRFGFVGRLQVEKNVRLLADLERELLKAGRKKFKFLIVGEGGERAYLEKTMRTAEFPGFLDGERLSEAYANMDVFVFSSETDAYGNVVQEANAAGVPCLVTDRGGPKFIVRAGKTGFVAKNLDEFVKFSIDLMDNPEKLAQMKKNSREFALSRSWDAVFESVYDAYAAAKEHLDNIKKHRKKRGAPEK
ncbi:MAG TPA: glycosyltransferase [Pyrinomonadaceae bacterium]|nr:glycosyltransferase [Pyrinomonadaceae bacterium]